MGGWATGVVEWVGGGGGGGESVMGRGHDHKFIYFIITYNPIVRVYYI